MCLWLENKQAKEYPLITLTAAAASVRELPKGLFYIATKCYQNRSNTFSTLYYFWKKFIRRIFTQIIDRGSLSNSLALFWLYRTVVCSAVTPCRFDIKLSVCVGNLFYFMSFMKMSAGYLNMSTAVVYSTVHAERLILINR